MTVNELINKLVQFHPDLPISLYIPDLGRPGDRSVHHHRTPIRVEMVLAMETDDPFILIEGERENCQECGFYHAGSSLHLAP